MTEKTIDQQSPPSRQRKLPVNILDKYVYSSTDLACIRSINGRATGHRFGVSVIRFDHDSVLFAVGGSNGIIRIFDFDECLGAMQMR